MAQRSKDPEPGGRARRHPRPTLRQVAERAGVSEITVSRVVRDSPLVAPPLAGRVRRAAAELGYVPNRLAGTLAGHASTQIAVILPALSNIVFTDVLKGLETGLEARGYHPILGISNYDPDHEADLIRGLLGWQPAGLVIATAGLSPASRAMLADAALPIVEIMDIDIDPIDMTVGISHHGAGRAIARHLLTRGHEDLAFIGHDLSRDHRARARLDGLRAELAAAGRGFRTIRLRACASSVALGADMTRHLLARARPRVICYANDDMAIGGVFACQAAGLAIPGDIAVTGFNGLDIGQAMPAPLTTIGTRRQEIGRVAAERLIARLDGHSPPQRTDVGFALIPGATS